MDVAHLLLEAYGRVTPIASDVVDGLAPEQLVWAPDDGANPIGWLVWHSARILDSHVADLDGEPQLWEGSAWAPRFGLPADRRNTGYAHSPADVAAVKPENADALTDYLEASMDRAVAYIETLGPDDLDRIVDRRWDPPVTLGVRLVSIVDDCVQHVGQAAYVRGLLDLRP